MAEDWVAGMGLNVTPITPEPQESALLACLLKLNASELESFMMGCITRISGVVAKAVLRDPSREAIFLGSIARRWEECSLGGVANTVVPSFDIDSPGLDQRSSDALDILNGLYGCLSDTSHRSALVAAEATCSLLGLFANARGDENDAQAPPDLLQAGERQAQWTVIYELEQYRHRARERVRLFSERCSDVFQREVERRIQS